MTRVLVQVFAVLCVVLFLAGCATANETRPARTATEQLLISHAAEKAARGFWNELTPGSLVFIDTTYFKGDGADYAISTLRQGLLAEGGRLASNRASADLIVEIRLAALSMDQMSWVVGTPSLDLPISSDFRVVRVPALSAYSRTDRSGVAEFNAFAYDAKTGKPVAMNIHGYGATHIRSHKLLMVLTWGKQTVDPGDASLDPAPWWKLW